MITYFKITSLVSLHPTDFLRFLKLEIKGCSKRKMRFLQIVMFYDFNYCEHFFSAKTINLLLLQLIFSPICDDVLLVIKSLSGMNSDVFFICTRVKKDYFDRTRLRNTRNNMLCPYQLSKINAFFSVENEFCLYLINL